MEYWSHFSVLNQDFRPVLPVLCGMPLSTKTKEESSFAQEEKQTISLPKRVQRLSDVKVSGRIVRSKWNLINNYNKNKNAGLKIITKDSWTRSQKIWAQNSVSHKGAWNEMSVDFICLDPSLWPSLSKTVPSTAAALHWGQQGAGLVSAKSSVQPGPWHKAQGMGHGTQDSCEHAAQGVGWKLVPGWDQLLQETQLVPCFHPCSSCSLAIKGSTQATILPPSRASAFPPCDGVLIDYRRS